MRVASTLMCLVFMGLISLAVPASGLAQSWPELTPEKPAVVKTTPSLLTRVGVGMVRFYQQVISPLDGPACGFRPTCSAYGRQAVGTYGFLVGSLMTADRLQRCNSFNHLGHYPVEPDGYLHDPIHDNYLF